MNLKDLVLRNRSYRRFYQDVEISPDMLREFIDLARLSASAANRQPLKYIISSDSGKNSKIFPHLRWASYLKEWPGPAAGERPAGYIVILGDTSIAPSAGCDHGIAAQSILLGAAEKGLGGCMIESVRRDALREVLELPERYQILLVIALGKPKESVVLETVQPGGDIKYWREADGTHHVPKRRLEDIIL